MQGAAITHPAISTILAKSHGGCDRIDQEARALVPDGQLIVGTHVGDGNVPRTERYGGVLVRWTTFRWQPQD